MIIKKTVLISLALVIGYFSISFMVVFGGYLEDYDCKCWLDGVVNFLKFPGFVVLAVVWDETGFYGFLALLLMFLVCWFLAGVMVLIGVKLSERLGF